jgi:MazG family protein
MSITQSPGASLPRLVAIMDRLLAPDGCPWDREQTLASLRPFLIEETCEVLDAIDSGSPEDHCEELGDLLLQIVFQTALTTRIADSKGFTIDEVIASVSEKLIRRHPHVFSAVTGVGNAAQVITQWDSIKSAETAAKNKAGGSALDGVPATLPALARAQKISSKASKVGFDWPNWQGSLDKVREETAEIAAIAGGDDAKAKHHEIGDLLFATVNTARKLGIDAELALRDATTRFATRFSHIEKVLNDRGTTPAASSLDVMDVE